MLDRIHRIWWQTTGVLLFNFPFIERLSFAWLPVPVLNCYSCPLAQGACPIGTIQHFFVIGSVPFLAVGVVGLFGLAAGRFYCGYLCPFGFLQDLLKRLSPRHIRIPRFLEYGKYAFLVITVIILPPLLLEPFFCTLCPAGTLEAGIPIVSNAWMENKTATDTLFATSSGILSMIGWWFWFKVVLLAVVVGAAVVIRRPFCRTMCPLGAIFGLFNRISLFIRHPAHRSPTTGKPVYRLKDCPVDIAHPDRVDSPSCIKCRQCYPNK